MRARARWSLRWPVRLRALRSAQHLRPPLIFCAEPLYPAINDLRHGYVGGLRYFKRYRDMPQQEFEAWIDSTLDSRKQRREGFIEELRDPALPNWQALDMRYDQVRGAARSASRRAAQRP